MLSSPPRSFPGAQGDLGVLILRGEKEQPGQVSGLPLKCTLEATAKHIHQIIARAMENPSSIARAGFPQPRPLARMLCLNRSLVSMPSVLQGELPNRPLSDLPPYPLGFQV